MIASGASLPVDTEDKVWYNTWDEVFQEVVDRHWRHLLKTAGVVLKDGDDHRANDVVQQAIAKVWPIRDRVTRHPEDLFKFLKVRVYWEAKRELAFRSASLGGRETRTRDNPNVSASSPAVPLDVVERFTIDKIPDADTRLMIEWAMNQLPENEAKAVLYMDQFGGTGASVSRLLGVSQRTVYNWRDAGRAKLRELLG